MERNIKYGLINFSIGFYLSSYLTEVGFVKFEICFKIFYCARVKVREYIKNRVLKLDAEGI